MNGSGSHQAILIPTLRILVLLTIMIMVSQSSAKAQQQQQQDNASFEAVSVAIPKGAANPTPDLTFQNLANWYEPRRLTVSVGDTVVWKNEDTEPHTVTSGRGAGIASAQTNEKGVSDGIFDSDLFGPEESWSYTFYTPGTFTYFCIIHPWMEGVVTVNLSAAKDIPTYPVDASGNRYNRWPAHTYSNDGRYDIDMKWDVPIVTGRTATFFIDFFDAKTNERLQLTPYEFIIMQDGKELDETYALTDVGTGIYKYEFSKPGAITMRVENVDSNSESWSEFTTVVYPNPESTATDYYGQNAEAIKLSGGTEPASRLINPLTLVTFTYAVIFGIPAAVGIVILLFKKGKI